MKLCPECFTEYQDDMTECPDDSVSLSYVKPDPLIGTKVSDRYTIMSVVGRGGMGVVYKAKHEMMDRTVAIKMLHAHLVSDAEAIKRFHREAKAVSRIQHPHTTALYDFGMTAKRQPFIVMDYVEGTSLKKLIAHEGPVALTLAKHIFVQVMEALTCAHREGVIHRDLKPENIMLTTRGNDEAWVEVVDFGISYLLATDQSPKISRITKIGDVCGSPPYMSPEQCISSLQIDNRSDIYSLGIVLFEALTGRLPYKAKSAVEMIDCHLYSQPMPLKIGNPGLYCCDAVNAVILRALQKQPEDRYQAMEEFQKEFCEAIALDSIKLKAYKQKAEVQSFENMISKAKGKKGAGAEVDTAVMPGNGSKTRGKVKPGQTSQSQTASSYATSKQNQSAVWSWVRDVFTSGGVGHKMRKDYVLRECPYCEQEMEPQVNFCLNCGRTPATPQEISKLRPMQKNFNFPKVYAQQENKGSPRFSDKARVVSSQANNNLGWQISVFVALFAFIFLFGQTQAARDVADVFAGWLMALLHQLQLHYHR